MNYILVTETLVLLIAASISPEKMLICCRLVVHAPQQIPGGFIHYQTLQLMFKLCQQEKKKVNSTPVNMLFYQFGGGQHLTNPVF